LLVRESMSRHGSGLPWQTEINHRPDDPQKSKIREYVFSNRA
jgi:hypothetical protein